MISRRRELIARFGLLAAALVAVWLLAHAQLDAAAARRQLAEQIDPARPGSLAAQLATANAAAARTELDLAVARTELARLGISLDELPGQLPRSSVTTRSTTTNTTTIPARPTPGSTPRPGPRGPAGPSGAPAPAAPDTSPAPAGPAPRDCLFALFGVGICRG